MYRDNKQHQCNIDLILSASNVRVLRTVLRCASDHRRTRDYSPLSQHNTLPAMPWTRLPPPVTAMPEPEPEHIPHTTVAMTCNLCRTLQSHQ